MWDFLGSVVMLIFFLMLLIIAIGGNDDWLQKLQSYKNKQKETFVLGYFYYNNSFTMDNSHRNVV